MNLKDEIGWGEWVKNNTDGYGGACINVARRVMEILDLNEPFDAHELICKADKETDTGGITGYMAGAVASMVSQCHERGDEFKKSWNKSWGVEEETDGVVNPAIITIGE